MTDHQRDYWVFRRKADWTILCTIFGMLGTIFFYGVKAVRAHSQWMDKVEMASAMTPKVEDHEKKLAVITSSIEDMKEDLKYIRRHMR